MHDAVQAVTEEEHGAMHQLQEKWCYSGRIFSFETWVNPGNKEGFQKNLQSNTMIK